jgi:hypothetical protein
MDDTTGTARKQKLSTRVSSRRRPFRRYQRTNFKSAFARLLFLPGAQSVATSGTIGTTSTAATVVFANTLKCFVRMRWAGQRSWNGRKTRKWVEAATCHNRVTGSHTSSSKS